MITEQQKERILLVYNEFHRLAGLYSAIKEYKLTLVEPSMRRLGYCCYLTKTIEIGLKHLLESKPEQILDTIRHECAHILAPFQKHNKIWKQKAILLGAKPEQFCIEPCFKEG